MKKKILMLFVMLLAGVGQMMGQNWEWTGETLVENTSYYLLNDIFVTSDDSKIHWLNKNPNSIKGDDKSERLLATGELSSAIMLTYCKTTSMWISYWHLKDGNNYLKRSNGALSWGTDDKNNSFDFSSQGNGYYTIKGDSRFINIENSGAVNNPKSATSSGNSELWKFISADQKSTYESYIDAYNSAKEAVNALNEAQKVIGTLILNVQTNKDNAEQQIGYLNNIVSICQSLSLHDATEIFIKNPSFETGDLTGWTTTDGSGSIDKGAKENSNTTYTMSNADKSYVFNFWDDKGGEKSISQNLTLPKGIYKLSVVLASDAKTTWTLSAGSNSQDFTNGENGKAVGVRVEMPFIVTSYGVVGIKLQTQNNAWFKCDDFRLTYIGEHPLSATRSTSGTKYGTICLPYNFMASGADLYTISNIDGTSIELATVTDNKGTAGVPYIYQNKEDNVNGQAFVYSDGEMVSEPSEGAKGLTGVLASAGATIPDGSYVLATEKSSGKQAFFLTNGVTCPQYKCYLTVPASGGSVKTFYFGSSDEETAIEGLFGESVKDGKFLENNKVVIIKNGKKFNIAGQRVK